MEMRETGPANRVPILEKALDILEYIGAHPDAVTLPELQKNLAISQASCYRIAATLTARGWLRKNARGYDIAGKLLATGEKARPRLERYRKLQPTMNRLSEAVGFSAKFSVRDGDEFVNVCSARDRSGTVIFSEVGIRASVGEPASVGTIFLEALPAAERDRILPEGRRNKYVEMSALYRKNGFAFHPGEPAEDAFYRFDTLSFPVSAGTELLGVISLLGLPGTLGRGQTELAARIAPYRRLIAEMLG